MGEYLQSKTRVFSTTIGHNNETVADARYLDLVTADFCGPAINLTLTANLKPATRQNNFRG